MVISKARALRRVMLFGALIGISTSCSPSPSRHSDVCLVTVESFRVDHVGCFGYSSAKTPTFDDLAQSGARFEQAIAQCCFTAPAMATLATGLFPVEHGVLQWGDHGTAVPAENLAQVLARAGYRTAFFGGHGALAGIQPLARGFEVFRDEPDREAGAIVGDALEWLRGIDGPAFVWLHFFEPHAPYRPGASHGRGRVPEGLRLRLEGYPFEAWEGLATSGEGSSFASRVAFLTSQYDGEIDRVDEALATLVAGLKRDSRFERAHVIVGADHGENLGDHVPFFDHRDFLYDSLVHVPLIWRGPGIPARVISETVGQVDLLATLFDVLGVVDSSRRRSGRSFQDLLQGAPTAGERETFSDSGRQADPHLAVRVGRLKLMRRLADGRDVLFDLAADPGELRDASLERPEDVRRLRSKLDAWLVSMVPAPRGDGTLGKAEEARLRSLGYR